MVENSAIINVTNRSRGSVGYVIPDMGNLQRKFAYGETKQITAEEVRKLDWTPGGHILLRDYLIIDNKELVAELLHEVEPEYNYTEDKIKDILLNGSMDEFMDCLDFAPEGVVSLMKDLAVKLEIPDVRKRQAISERTNSSVDNAIKINQLSKTEDDEKAPEVKQRRVQTADAATATQKERRTNPSAPQKYKVVSK